MIGNRKKQDGAIAAWPGSQDGPGSVITCFTPVLTFLVCNVIGHNCKLFGVKLWEPGPLACEPTHIKTMTAGSLQTLFSKWNTYYIQSTFINHKTQRYYKLNLAGNGDAHLYSQFLEV